MHFKDISYLDFWRPFCSAEWNHLCNFGRGHYEEQFFVINLQFGPMVQEEMAFKRFLIWSSGGPPVQSRTIYAILKEGIGENIHFSYIKLGLVVQEMSFKEKVNGRTDGRRTKTDHNSSP